MKKMIGCFLAAVSAVAVCAETTGTIKDDAAPFLRARKEPKFEAPVVLKTLKPGTKVTIIRRCDENWLELALPPDAPVYVDEIFVVKGKVSRNLKMYAVRGRVPKMVWGELKKGETVTLTDDRAHGWVRIVPPDRLRVYVWGSFVEGAEAVKPEAKPEAKPETKPAVKPEAKPAVKTETKPEVKPAVKPEVKPETKPEVKPAVKPEVKPETKPAVKPAVKPETKPAVKPAVKPETKPAVKPAVKPEVKLAVKPETKPAAKPAVKPEVKLTPVKPDAALLELRVKENAKGVVVKRTGTLCDATGNIRAARFMLIGDNDELLGFVYLPGREAELKKQLNKKLTVHGTLFAIPGWKNPVIVAQKLEEAR